MKGYLFLILKTVMLAVLLLKDAVAETTPSLIAGYEFKRALADRLEGSVLIALGHSNPLNPETKMEFSLPADSKVYLIVYDLTGREISGLINNEFRKADYYTVMFNAGSLPSGLYFYKIGTNNF